MNLDFKCQCETPKIFKIDINQNDELVFHYIDQQRVIPLIPFHQVTYALCPHHIEEDFEDFKKDLKTRQTVVCLKCKQKGQIEEESESTKYDIEMSMLLAFTSFNDKTALEKLLKCVMSNIFPQPESDGDSDGEW